MRAICYNQCDIFSCVMLLYCEETVTKSMFEIEDKDGSPSIGSELLETQCGGNGLC